MMLLMKKTPVMLLPLLVWLLVGMLDVWQTNGQELQDGIA